MLVGQNVTLRIDDESATHSARRPLRLPAQQVIEWIARCAIGLVLVIGFSDLERALQRVDVHDRRLNPASDFHERR